MGHSAAVLLTMVALTLPMSGQRGGVRAGSGGGVRVQGSLPRAGSIGAFGGRAAGPVARVNRVTTVARAGGVANSDHRRTGFVPDRHRAAYGGYGRSVPVILPIWSGWGGLGDAGPGYDAAGYGEGAPTADGGYAAAGVKDDWQAEGPGPYGSAYPVAPVYAAAAPVTRPMVAPEPEEAVTLVFRDGREAEQIHNYALTRTRLMVLDGRPREIPLETLDLAATERVNRAAGVEFRVPGGGGR